MSDQLVSIIMPAYNAEAYISIAIDSILSQTYTNWELIIADDSSSDQTKKIIERYTDPRIRTMHNSTNMGYLKTCNKLFKACKGGYITFQDSDDFSTPDRISLQVDAFKKDSELKICGTQIYELDNFNLEIKKYPLSDQEIKSTLLDRFPFCGATIMILSDMYDKFGGYHEVFDRIGSEDYEWAGRIIKRHKSINLSNITYYYRRNFSSITKSTLRPGNFISHELAKKMINNSDLSQNQVSLLKKQLLEPFKQDSSLLHRLNCDHHAYYNNIKALRHCAWMAFKTNPLKLANQKYFISSLLPRKR